MHKPIQYLMVGLPFSGKTTLSRALEKELGFARINIDEIKFKHGFEGVSDDDVPDEQWDNIFKESYERLIRFLKEGKSVVHETAWTTRKWRDKARRVAEAEGFPTKVIYVKVPVEVARERFFKNRETNKRFDLPDKIFDESVEEFEEPTTDEDVIVYNQSMSMDEWIKQTFLKNLVKKGYNKVAENYASQRNQFRSDKYLDKFIELLKQGTVLDIGCGAGTPIDKYLIDRGFKVIGIDISEKQIELAKKNIPEADYEIKDMSELEHGEYQVNGVVSTYAIFHTPREEHQELFNKINSFLPKGGIILVTMGAGEWEGTEDDFHGAKMWWSHYGPEKNREIVENAGFEVILDEIDSGNDESHQIIIARKM